MAFPEMNIYQKKLSNKIRINNSVSNNTNVVLYYLIIITICSLIILLDFNYSLVLTRNTFQINI